MFEEIDLKIGEAGQTTADMYPTWYCTVRICNTNSSCAGTGAKFCC